MTEARPLDQGPGTDALLDTLPCGLVSFTDEGSIVLVNATLLAMLGYGREEVEGRHVEMLLTVAGRIFYQTHLFPLVRLHGRASELFLLLRCRDGSDVGALVNAVRHERGGRAVTDCVLMEVRERRKYEDALLRAKQAAEEARAVLHERTTELERLNEMLERQAVELELQQEQLQEQATELEAQSDELHAVNEALEAQQVDLEKARDAAEEANRAKSQFLATMSHELRTPLNAIGGYVQLMQLGIHGPVTDAQREALDRVLRSQLHLLRLINDILNLARIEAGRVEYALERVPIDEVVTTVLPMVEPQMVAAGLTCETALDEGLVVHADREKLQQILINLLGNALKFTPTGGTIRLHSERAHEGERALLHVTDTGIGIPPEKLERIFEPFIQVETGHARRKEGTGLGLSISRDLARGMGGDLIATSVEGQGSTFTLALPLSRA